MRSWPSAPPEFVALQSVQPIPLLNFRWWRESSLVPRRALIAASMGWQLDSFDVMLYALVLATLMADLEI